MSKVLDQPRYKCALAAMQTVQSIPGAIPILHAGPGCASKLNDNNGSSGHYAANVYPCSLVSEKHPVPVYRIGIRDEFGHSGPAKELLEEFGLTAPYIAEEVRKHI